MLILGELFNTSREVILENVTKRNAGYVQKLAREQVEAGADYLDISCGQPLDTEIEVMKWLLGAIQEAVEAPLSIDTTSVEAMETGLSLARFGQPILNSITAEQENFQKMLPLILEHRPKVVGLCMNDQGIPTTASGRWVSSGVAS